MIVTGADPGFCSGDDVGEVMASPDGGLAQRKQSVIHNPPTPAAMAVLECAFIKCYEATGWNHRANWDAITQQVSATITQEPSADVHGIARAVVQLDPIAGGSRVGPALR